MSERMFMSERLTYFATPVPIHVCPCSIILGKSITETRACGVDVDAISGMCRESKMIGLVGLCTWFTSVDIRKWSGERNGVGDGSGLKIVLLQLLSCRTLCLRWSSLFCHIFCVHLKKIFGWCSNTLDRMHVNFGEVLSQFCMDFL